jgi:monovalent cation/hydrogen antiporter
VTLPWLVRALGLSGGAGEGPSRDEQQAVAAELKDAAAKAVTDDTLVRRDGDPFPEGLVKVVGARLTQPPQDDVDTRTRDLLELRLAIIEVMRDRLNELSHGGRFSTAALRRALAELDADQVSLELRLDDEDD